MQVDADQKFVLPLVLIDQVMKLVVESRATKGEASAALQAALALLPLLRLPSEIIEG